MLKFGVAKELGKTLHEIGEMTEQELIGWSAYFQVVNEEQEKDICHRLICFSTCSALPVLCQDRFTMIYIG